jgi:hypothetical protein
MRLALAHFRGGAQQQYPLRSTTAQPQSQELQSAVTNELDEYINWRKRMVAECHSFWKFYYNPNSSALYTNRDGEPNESA